MQSKTARYVLGRSRKDWSRTEGYRELNWLTIPQTSVEFSLRMFFKVLWNKKPERIFSSLYDDESMSVRKLTEEQIAKLRNLSRKSWCTRVLRYADILPESLYCMDPNRQQFRIALTSWVSMSIEKDRDFIFKGRMRPEKCDWLSLEVAEWRRKLLHESESLAEQRTIENDD